jgi:hypothetical protein
VTLLDLWDDATVVAAMVARSEAIAAVDARVTDTPSESDVVRTVTLALLAELADVGRREFSADDLGVLLDQRQVATDLATRRRICSTIITRGAADGLWHKIGYVSSRRRKCAPIVQWRVGAP